MPNTFAPSGIDIWMSAQVPPKLMEMRDARFFSGLGRMKPRVTIAQASADLNRVAGELGKEFGKTDANWSALLTDYKQLRVGSNARSLTTMFAATVLLLLILCANVAGLLLGQFQRRDREFAIRASLGGDTSQIAAVVLREIVALAMCSGAVGLCVAYWGTELLSRVFADLPRMQEVQFDWRIVLFTAMATVFTALVCGLIPTIQVMRRDLNTALAQGGRSHVGGKRRTQQILVAAQFTITVVLLVGAGLLLRSYYNLTHVPTGFRAGNVVTFHVGAGWGEDRAKIGVMQQQILAQFEQTPGVAAAGVTNFLPASGATLREQVQVEGVGDAGEAGKVTVGTRMISEGYLRALGFPLLRGSLCPAFNPDPNQPTRAVVNRRFVDAAGGVDVIGRKVTFSNVGGRPFQIVGVIGDAKEDALNAGEVPYVYLCMWAGAWPDPEYAVALNGDARPLMRAIPEIVHRIAPDRAVFGVQPLSDVLDRTLDRPRLNAGVLAVFAASALLSAALGLYGLMTLVVTGRTREIGVRMAVGATPARIVSQVVGEALRPLVFAVIAGWGLALLAVRAFRSILFDVPETDLLTYGSVCVLLILVAAASALIPGRRAATIDPVEALRTE
jgi:putative ABC transport system permease protein